MEKVKPFVPGGRKGKRSLRRDGSRFFDALLWIARSRARWRDLPKQRFGNYPAARLRWNCLEYGRVRAVMSNKHQRAPNPFTEISADWV